MPVAKGTIFSGEVGTVGTIRVYVKRDGKCECGEEGCKGKHPKTPRWVQLPNSERATYEGEALGVRTGPHTGIFVVDVDGPEGVASLAELEERHGKFPPTLVRSTPSGGRHFYFKDLPNSKGISSTSRLGPKIDTRGAGGQVVFHAPGYTTIYGAELPELADAPAWIVAVFNEWSAPVASPSYKGNRPSRREPPADLSAWKVAALLLANVWPPDGARHDAHNALVGALLWNGWTDEETERFVSLLYAALGDPDNLNIHRNIQTTVRKIAKGDPVTGWTRLGQCIGKDVASAVRKRLGFTETAIELWGGGDPSALPAGHRARKNPNHRYTFDANACPDGKLRPITLGELKWVFANHADWQGRLQWNDRAQCWIAVNPPLPLDAEQGRPSEEDITRVRLWIQGVLSAKTRKEDVRDTLLEQARSVPFDPVLDYLDALSPSDSSEDAFGELSDLLGVETEAERENIRNVLVGAVARAYRPGEQVDTMLVLQGAQDVGKSKLVAALFGREFTREGIPPLDSKEAAMALRKFWAVEIPEMSSWLRTSESAKKDFITRRVDVYRPPYAREDVEVPRRCVFVGTINPGEFLTDETGNRRYGIVKVRKVIDIEAVKELRDRLWATARDLYFAGYKYWIFDQRAQEEIKAEFQESDPWAEAVAEYLETVEETTTIKALEVAIYKHDIAALQRIDRRQSNRMCQVLRSLGWKVVITTRKDRKRERVWKKGD